MLGGDTELLNEHFDVSSLPSELGGAKDPYDPTDWIKTMIHADTQQNRQTDDVSITNPTIATSTWSMICTVRKTQWHKRNDICTIMIATENCTQMWQYSGSGLNNCTILNRQAIIIFSNILWWCWFINFYWNSAK